MGAALRRTWEEGRQAEKVKVTFRGPRLSHYRKSREDSLRPLDAQARLHVALPLQKVFLA
jgi:hypothetical protein